MNRDPHSPTEDFATTSALDLATAIADGSTTSAQCTAAALERVGAVDRDGTIELNAVIALDREGAMAAATAADRDLARGRRRSALHGVPVLVKDNIEAMGLPASAGSLALSDRPARRDSTVVARMRAAGMVVVGATNLSEWANIRSHRSTSGWSAVGGLTANPWSLGHSAGGSSSGSGAAVAAGYTPLALGTETDGSITCPSSLNGVVGLKPTVGRVPTDGIVPISASQDAPGPMGRCVADVAALFDVMAGTAAATGLGEIASRDVRVGVARGWFSGHAPTDDAMESLLGELADAGVVLHDVEVEPTPDSVHEAELGVLLTELREDLSTYLADRGGTGFETLGDVVAFNRANAERELVHFGQELFELALAAEGRNSERYLSARAACRSWAVDNQLAPAIDDVDVLIAPAFAPAWVSNFAEGDRELGGGRASAAPSIAGWPVLCQPLAVVDGLPVGVVLIARPDDEARLLAAGLVVERIIGLAGTGELSPRWAPRSA